MLSAARRFPRHTNPLVRLRVHFWEIVRLSPKEADSLYIRKGLVATGRYVTDDLAARVDNDYFVG